MLIDPADVRVREKPTAVSILDEPAPCDGCPQRRHCARTGDACAAFAAFYDGRVWELQRRVPSSAIGARILGPRLRHVERQTSITPLGLGSVRNVRKAYESSEP